MRLSPTRILCAAILLLTLLLISFVTRLLFGQRGFDILPERPDAGTLRSRPNSNAPDVQYGEECAPFRAGALDDVTIVLKLGAGQVATQLPAYFSRLSRCTHNVLLFSDLKAEYGGFDIIDALANLRPEYKYNNPDFDIYDKIQHATVLEEKTTEGWRLDKYKFLPMIELADARRPKSNWFLFLELDTYVNWDNMQRFLASFDPKTPYYFGSPVWPRKKPVFAHGGSGFVLSRGAFNKLMARGRMFAENHRSPGTHLFGKDVRKECCGDEVLAKVLKESGIAIRGYWPMFNGESPSTLRFNWEQWCEAVLTLHHVQPDEFASLEHWEAGRPQRSKPLTFETLFPHIEPALQERRDDWTNLSEDITYTGKKTAGRSWEACRAACSHVHKCMQYEHIGDTCRLSRSIRLGHAQPASSAAGKATSGWMTNRIESFKAFDTRRLAWLCVSHRYIPDCGRSVHPLEFWGFQGAGWVGL
ncbi:glycosyltransferase family 31 protein [Karstenula rhodostoma CBS 690.94]|uniref:N-acetylgalactosaminide beta-1,3-galactosyltransferase n=1 Tax=Karstenula rhodostoma CBS 690.94 TaxID=1392251 RepID=A0A9P4PAC7_9PLEO|nr:glycosyltransferase family 31 protein [Karstenula rhodostoma CBS 690.94]